jgi:hypothetical protein
VVEFCAWSHQQSPQITSQGAPTNLSDPCKFFETSAPRVSETATIQACRDLATIAACAPDFRPDWLSAVARARVNDGIPLKMT